MVGPVGSMVSLLPVLLLAAMTASDQQFWWIQQTGTFGQSQQTPPRSSGSSGCPPGSSCLSRTTCAAQWAGTHQMASLTTCGPSTTRAVCCPHPRSQGGGANQGASSQPRPSREGSCPMVSLLPLEQCRGRSSACWSPGVPDTDCRNNALCCFDGCSNVCQASPGSPASAQPGSPQQQAVAPPPRRPAAPAQQEPYVTCPSSMTCVPKNFCDLKGVTTMRAQNYTPQLEALRVPLIPCVNQQRGNTIGVCCRDVNNNKKPTTISKKPINNKKTHTTGQGGHLGAGGVAGGQGGQGGQVGGVGQGSHVGGVVHGGQAGGIGHGGNGGGVGQGGQAGGQGSCSSNADCPSNTPVCSEYGYCQCASYRPGGPECWQGGQGGGGGQGGEGGQRRCSSNANCPAATPVCSDYGFCQCASYRPGGPECWNQGW